MRKLHIHEHFCSGLWSGLESQAQGHGLGWRVKIRVKVKVRVRGSRLVLYSQGQGWRSKVRVGQSRLGLVGHGQGWRVKVSVGGRCCVYNLVYVVIFGRISIKDLFGKNKIVSGKIEIIPSQTNTCATHLVKLEQFCLRENRNHSVSDEWKLFSLTCKK